MHYDMDGFLNGLPASVEELTTDINLSEKERSRKLLPDLKKLHVGYKSDIQYEISNGVFTKCEEILCPETDGDAENAADVCFENHLNPWNWSVVKFLLQPGISHKITFKRNGYMSADILVHFPAGATAKSPG